MIINCKNFICIDENRAICTAMAERSGGIVKNTHPNLCNLYCSKYGPYCGKEISEEEINKFVARMFIISYTDNGTNSFAERVIDSYSKNKLKLEFPDKDWPIIKNELKPFIDLKKVKNIYLTGSLVLLGKKHHKDYDIVLEINDWKDIPKLEKELPRFINNIKCDYFFSTTNGMEIRNKLFCTFDPENKIFYYSSWYNVDVEECPKDWTLIKGECWNIGEFLKELHTKQCKKETNDRKEYFKLQSEKRNKIENFINNISKL